MTDDRPVVSPLARLHRLPPAGVIALSARTVNEAISRVRPMAAAAPQPKFNSAI
jgi:hypothetical protein